MAYAAVIYRTGHLRNAVIAHAVTNVLMAAKLLSSTASCLVC